MKLIEIQNQKILINPDLIEEMLIGQKKREINYIINTAKSKGNLNYFLSKRALQSNFHDHLQSEWNIYHFHLSLEKDKRSDFVKQSNALLFAYIDDRYIVFLGIETHKKGIFGDLKWVEILHEKFQFVLEEYKDKSDIIDVTKYNSEEIQALWSKGISLGFYKIKDVIYHSPGIGRTTSGHSMAVSTTTMHIMRWLKNMEKQLSNYKNFTSVSDENINFKLRIKDKIEIYEANSNSKIIEFPQIFKEVDVM